MNKEIKKKCKSLGFRGEIEKCNSSTGKADIKIVSGEKSSTECIKIKCEDLE